MEKGIQHRKVTPYWPQANAEVERFNQPLEKIIRAAHIEGKNWRQELYKFLLTYRATPHAVTGIAPCQLMFGRELRTKVPQLRKPGMTKAFIVARRNDNIKKQQQKTYADSRQRAFPSPVQKGDKVLLQQTSRNKLSTRYDPRPYIVLARKGPSVVLQRGTEPRILRNVSRVRRLYEVDANSCDDDLFPVTRAPRSENAEMNAAARVEPRPQRLRRPPEYLRDYEVN